MEDRKLGINIVIDGISSPLTIDAAEEPYYRQAARLTNVKLNRYKNDFSNQGDLKAAIMTALELALELMKKTDSVGSAEVIYKVNELSRLVDKALANKE